MTTQLATAPPPAACAPTAATAPTAPSRLTKEALAELYQRLERRVFNVVYRWLWNKEDAFDVVQEAFVKLWAMRDRVQMETVEALAYRIAVNLAANRRRQRQVWRLVTLEGLRTEPKQIDDTQRRVRAAVDALPEQLRRVVLLGEFSGMTAKEIGAVLEIPEGTVASRRHHALAMLRAQLGDVMEALDD